METETDLPVFMGVCESALIRGDGVLQDFYGVGDLLALPFFPQNLNGVFLLLGLPKKLITADRRVRIMVRSKEDPKQKAWSDLQIVVKTGEPRVRISGFAKHYLNEGERTGPQGKADHAGTPLLMFPKMPYKPIPIPCPPLLVLQPDEIEVIAEINGREFRIGAFRCEFCPTPPISEQERIAIMSRPGAIKGIVCGMECKKCHDRVEFCLPLDGKSKPSGKVKGCILLTSAPDEWNCKCGETKIPLIYLKQGFHALFRTMSAMGDQREFKFVPLYQKGAIAAIIGQYQKVLVDYGDDEEAVQKFIEATPILWNFLAPKKIWRKPPILTKYKADFGILNRSNIFYFVEIEKPKTKLVKKGGGVSSDLEAGLDQIRNWRIEVEKRREAVLDGLSLAQKDVHDIRYILIAGMASQTTTAGLEKIRKMTDANFIFCFDELASFLHSTETALLNI